ISDVEKEIVVVFNELLKELHLKLRSFLGQFKANLQTVAYLDSLYAKAIYMDKYQAIVAIYRSDEQIIDLKRAGHPLIDPTKCVYNNYHLNKDKNIIIVSGPNTGGKSITLKLISLDVLLTYSGMPIIALEATIGHFDHVLIDIGDNQSVLNNLSTFSAHLTNIKTILDYADNKSLIVIDELGNGTDPTIAYAFAKAILERLRYLKANVIVSTHYSEIKNYAYEYDNIMISSVQFDLDNLQPTYKYLENVVGNSFALEIASKYGIDQNILNQAKQYIDDNKPLSQILIDELEKEKQRQAVLNMEVEQLQSSLEAKQKEYDHLVNNFNQEKQRLLNKYQEQMENELRVKIEEAHQLIEDFKKLDKPLLHQSIEVYNKVQQLNDNKDMEEDSDTNYQIGDYIQILATAQYGTITAIKKNDIIVDASGVTMKVKRNNIRKALKPQPKKVSVVSKKIWSKPKMEINVIGLNVEEGLMEVDKFIDSAIVNNCPSVNIIHGVGSGILRKAIINHLKNRKYINTVESATLSNGGAGVSVVTFKR
ncbi:MAG: Smr/MutS family protein, partial [Erysipelotrichaceae bacterium]